MENVKWTRGSLDSLRRGPRGIHVKFDQQWVESKARKEDHKDMSRGHMTNQNLIFHYTHEEEQDTNSASSLSFTYRLTTRIVQILTSHVIVRCVSVIVLNNVWSI